MLSNIKSVKNIRQAKRLGRGAGSGKGQTSGRGTKGQKSRSGYNIPRRFEGGQTPLIARLPKAKGFNSVHEKASSLNIAVIEKKFNDGELVNLKALKLKKLIDKDIEKVKVLGSKSTKFLKYREVALSKNIIESLKKVEKSVEKTVDKAQEKPVKSAKSIKTAKPVKAKPKATVK